jgi:hypothetical protein
MSRAILASRAGGHARATDLPIGLARTWPDSRLAVRDLLDAHGDRGRGLPPAGAAFGPARAAPDLAAFAP